VHTAHLLLLLVSVALVSIWLYISTRLITGHEDLDVLYVGRLVIVALVVVLIAPVLSSIGGIIGIPEIGAVIAFIGILYCVKFFIISDVGGVDEWQQAIWITFLALAFIYAFNALISYLTHVNPLGGGKW